MYFLSWHQSQLGILPNKFSEWLSFDDIIWRNATHSFPHIHTKCAYQFSESNSLPSCAGEIHSDSNGSNLRRINWRQFLLRLLLLLFDSLGVRKSIIFTPIALFATAAGSIYIDGGYELYATHWKTSSLSFIGSEWKMQREKHRIQLFFRIVFAAVLTMEARTWCANRWPMERKAAVVAERVNTQRNTSNSWITHGHACIGIQHRHSVPLHQHTNKSHFGRKINRGAGKCCWI